MNPFLLGPRERLADWKSLRESLKTLPEAEQLAKVALYWGQAPQARYAYDPEDPASWPTMWEMINANDWCQHSVAIGMEQTLRLSGWAPERLKLLLVKDYDLSDIRFVVQIDDSVWLNYDYQIASAIPDTRRDILCGWQFQGKSYKDIL